MIEGYDMFRQQLVCSSHSGLVIYVANSLQANELDIHDSDELCESYKLGNYY